MPSVLSVSTLPKVLRSIPLVIFAIVIAGYIYPSLLTVMFGFGALKVLEYSIMTSATEMIYMPMSSEQRYLGKELIRFFGHRMGRSAAVMILSAASAHFKPSMATQVCRLLHYSRCVYFLRQLIHFIKFCFNQSLWGGAITAMWCGVMFILSRHLALRNDPHAEAERSEEPLIVPSAGLEKAVHHKHTSAQPVYKTHTHRKESTAVSAGVVTADSASGVRIPSDRTDNSNGSYDQDTTSESGSDGDTPPDSSDSLNTYYLAPEESERDLNTQDRDGKTLTITPSFNLLSALTSASAALKVDAASGGAVCEGEDDYADFVVLDGDGVDYNRSSDTQTEQGREIDDMFLRVDPLCAVYEVEEKHLNDEGLRRRANPSHKKTEKSSRKSYKIRREKRSSDNLSEAAGIVTAVVSQKDLLNSIRRAHSTVKIGSKKFSDTWMCKINGTENGRPLMFRVGSTCMTMNNLVNENRERSTKNED